MNNIPAFIAESAKNYYNYLCKKNKGIRTIDIKKISLTSSQNTLKLIFAEKVADFDYVSCVFVDNIKVVRDGFKVLKSDSYSATLTMPAHLFLRFKNCKSAKLIIDFKQLVYRVGKRFEGLPELHCPSKKPSIDFNYDKFSDVGFTKQQLKALDSIFSSPISYIWGVAGSGKTKYVLAYAIVNYLLSGKKILLAAPTNIALENALSAIIPIARNHGLKDSVMLRAGVPSTQFFNDFPSCCENHNIDKTNKALCEKKEDLTTYIHSLHTIDTLSRAKRIVDSISDAEKQLTNLEQSNKKLSSEISTNTKAIERETICLNTINDTINAVLRKKKSILYKIRNAFLSDNDLDLKLIELTVSLKETNSRINTLHDSNDKCVMQLNYNQKNETELKNYISAQEQIISEEISASLNTVLDTQNPEQIEEQFSHIREAQDQLQQRIIQKYPAVNFSDTESVDKLLQEITEEINSNIEKSEKHNNELLLYGCTLDKFMSYEVKRGEFSHVFLDEACYSCIAKAASVFICDCPVTFLGDHMQLPPVSELNADDFKRYNISNDLFIWIENGIYSYNLFDSSFADMFNDFMNCTEHISEDIAVEKLTGTHRFGQELSEVLDRFVYNIGLHSLGGNNTKISVIDAPHFINYKKRTSVSEAVAVSEYIKQNKPDNYIVLSPYKNQVELIRSKLAPDMSSNVLTVHKSQGQEWDCVILSVTDTADKFFTDSQIQVSRGKELLNTAISRARKQLVIVCDVQYWKTQSGQLITELINISMENFIELKKEEFCK